MHRCLRLALLVFLAAIVLAGLVLWRLNDRAEPEVTGHVIDATGPVAGVPVRWQGERRYVATDGKGRFRLPAREGEARLLTACRPGFRIAAVVAKQSPVELRLEPLPAEDDETYQWIGPHPNANEPNNCANCHDEIYREWNGSAHARAARNPRLLELIADPDGKSPPGWDLSREHPLGVGVCATCHAPTVDGEDDLRRAQGVAADGVHCDYCHKVVEAPIDKLGTRFGRDGLVLRRPPNGDLLSYGPLPDAVRTGESFAQLPLYKESQACASCHEGVLFGVHVYSTYSEWLGSPAWTQGRHCQSCHMTPTGRLTNIAPGKDGIERDPRTLASHSFPGSGLDMLRRSLTADVRCPSEPGGGNRIEVTLRADDVGHRVPTGFIDRHLLLVVQAFDADGGLMPPLAGPRLPKAAGKWTGTAGVLYGRLLHRANDDAPLPFWIPGLELADTRLRPQQPERSSFAFAARPARVEVQLWYRRFWQNVADARGWRDNDVLVLQHTLMP
jgi:hypothetical protein